MDLWAKMGINGRLFLYEQEREEVRSAHSRGWCELSVGGRSWPGPRGAFYGNQGFSGEAVPGDAVDTSIDDGRNREAKESAIQTNRTEECSTQWRCAVPEALEQEGASP
jgi:hypothetical protein